MSYENEHYPASVIDIIRNIPLPLAAAWISEDMDAFYQAHEAYLNDKDDFFVRADFERKGWELFLSVKHREVEGFLTPAQAEELRDHMRDLLDDQF